MTTEDLFAIQVVGAGPLTIKADGNRYDGFATSAAMALHDYHRLAYILHIETRDELEKAHPDIPGPLLTAVASRESGIGAALTSDGWGDRGNAFGILQVDHRYHTLLGPPDPYSFAHMQQAAGILAKAHDDMMTKFPDWQPAMQWRAAVHGPSLTRQPALSLCNVSYGGTRDWSERHALKGTRSRLFSFVTFEESRR